MKPEPQPQRSECEQGEGFCIHREQPPATDDKQEWTPEYCRQYFGVTPKLGRDISFAINAALKEAKLEEIARCRAILHDEICRVQDALAGEIGFDWNSCSAGQNGRPL